MLQIHVPTEDIAQYAETMKLLADIKGTEVTTYHEWKIPCGSGIQLTIKLEGPVGMKAEPAFFDQAIKLLTVAKDGVAGWPGTTVIDAGDISQSKSDLTNSTQ